MFAYERRLFGLRDRLVTRSDDLRGLLSGLLVEVISITIAAGSCFVPVSEDSFGCLFVGIYRNRTVFRWFFLIAHCLILKLFCQGVLFVIVTQKCAEVLEDDFE